MNYIHDIKWNKKKNKNEEKNRTENTMMIRYVHTLYVYIKNRQ